ncbi:bi-domain-containing oxidoreductase [Pirellulaceae bacterium SH449]
MRQILQNLGSGETIMADVPTPRAGSGAVLIRTSQSLVSLGTEKMLIEFGKGNLLAKARSQPDKVKQVLQKIKTDGLWATIDTVRAKLDTPISLGYCNVGVIEECGNGTFHKPGTRVVSNGPHAEWVAVGNNLTAEVPDGVSDETAAFTVVGSIALQGIRLIQPSLGEKIAVFGLGLIGLLAVQILKANGCQVLGIDFDPKKLELARRFGAETVDLSAGQDPPAVAADWTKGIGVDAVLITASTKSDELVHQAATMCRQRGRIVLVGVVGLNLQRADFYEKELSFQVSCSYGPGRYDEDYEKRGLDYPIGFVRWTEKRNFEAILQLMADGQINVDPLITHRFDFDDALKAYEAISEPGAMGILLQYETGSYAPDTLKTTSIPSDYVNSQTLQLAKNPSSAISPRQVIVPSNRDVGVAFIGAGGFSTRMLLPALPIEDVKRICVVSSSGVSAAHAAKKFGFERAESRYEAVLEDETVDAVFITTPHHLHARMVCKSLDAGKHVFVEKPLALNNAELELVQQAITRNPNLLLMVGFNRRFSPHSVAIQKWLESAPSNKAIVITVNAGAIPQNHWTQNPTVGGGRIVGEACHFIDLARYLIDRPIVETSVTPVRGGDGRLKDCASMNLSFEDGSIATIHYLSNGNKDFPKERIEVFAGGRVCVCDNFLKSYEIGGKRRLRTRSQDKGHKEGVRQFLNTIRNGGTAPIDCAELIEVSAAAIDFATRM